MLLEGSYKKDIEKVLAALKVTRRHKIRDGLLKVHERYVQFILSAATIPTHGKLSVEKYIESHFPKVYLFDRHDLILRRPFLSEMLTSTNITRGLPKPSLRSSTFVRISLL
jgi:hypothetical protein